MPTQSLCAFFSTVVLACLSLSFGLATSQAQTLSPELLPQTHQPVASPKIVASYGKMPLRFEANRGQTDPRVQFVSHGEGYTLLLTSNEAVLTLGASAAKQALSNSPLNAISAGSQPNQNTAVVRLQLLGANRAPEVIRDDELPTKSNYFIGNDPSKWHRDIPNYGKVSYGNVYPGIDLVYYGNQRQLEHDFVVSPGANPSLIALRVRGADSLSLDSAGNLLLMTQGGVLQLEKPVIYQMVGGNRQAIAGGYRLSGDSTVAFDVSSYDHRLALVIDPVLSYSTYLGGSSSDIFSGVATDARGNVYVAGYTTSVDFPTASALQGALGGGYDIIVSKLSEDGSSLLYSTYIGGSGDDLATAIAVDASGRAVIVGETGSPDFPVKNALQKIFGGGTYDAFVTQLSADGSGVVASTYLGGAGSDAANGVALDANGSVFLTGSSSSTNFPLKGAFQSSLRGPSGVFVAKLSSDILSLTYATYLGGTGADTGSSIAVDSTGSFYITGQTQSSDFPVRNAFQTTYHGGGSDAFVTRFSADGSTLMYSTYLGGSGSYYATGCCQDDWGLGIAVDANSNAYVAGRTLSADFPTQTPIRGYSGLYDGFVSKFGPDGSLLWSTFLGGGGWDGLGAIALDTSENILVLGGGDSRDYPLVNALQNANAGSYDVFLSEITADGTKLLFSTYLGGSASDGAAGIAISSFEDIYIAGYTNSANFPTKNALLPGSSGGTDAFIVKIGTATLAVNSLSLTFNALPGGLAPASQALSITNTGERTLNWTLSKTQPWLSLDSTSGTTPASINVSVSPAGLTTGTYQDAITITAPEAGKSPQTVAVTLILSPAPDFKVEAPAGGNASATVAAGSTASYNLAATPLNGFTGSVSFTCSGLPSKSSCSVNPGPANITGTASVPLAVAIATTASTTSTAGIFTGFGSSPWGILAGVIVLLGNFWLLSMRTRKGRQLLILVLFVCAFGTIGCGGGGSSTSKTTIPGTPAGIYTVVLTSNSGSITHATNLTLTVQ